MPSFPKQEVENTFENSPANEIFIDKPSYSNRSQSSDSESNIIDNLNFIQTIEDNFNETQINKLRTQTIDEKLDIKLYHIVLDLPLHNNLTIISCNSSYKLNR